MRRISILSMLVLMIFACATIPTSEDYQAKSAQEAEIIETVLKLGYTIASQEAEIIEAVMKMGYAIDSHNNEAFISLLDPELKMVTAYPQGTIEFGTLDRAQAASYWEKRMQRWRQLGIKGKMAKPLVLDIKGAHAIVVVPYKIWTTHKYRYWELGRLHLEYRKSGSGWLMTRYIWDLVDCNHPKYSRKELDQKRQAILSPKWVHDYSHPFTAGYPPPL